MRVKGLFRPHYLSWSERQRIEQHAQPHLKNIVRIITETGPAGLQETHAHEEGPVGPCKRGRLDS